MFTGLGAMYKTDPSTGTVIDCDLWSNLFQSACWNPFSATVVPVAPAGGATSPDGTPVAAVPAVPADPTTCSQTFITGVCDSIVYAVGLGLGALVLMPTLTGRRR